MKTKSLLLAFAGLGLFACSNEEFNENGVNGEANVSVRIDEPTLSRAIDAGNFTNSTAVTLNSIKLVLTAQTGSAEKTFNLNDEGIGGDRAKLLEEVNKFQFLKVRNPSKMEVFINTVKSSGWTLADVVNTELAEPLYASSKTFVDKGDTDDDNINEYQVDLTPAHTVARLELGGIEHIHSKVEGTEDEKPCMFKTINIDGIFLNKVAGTTAATDWATAQTNTPVHSVIGTSEKPVSFVTGQKWPADGKCYGYNILPVTSGNLPVLTVCFSNITIDTEKYDGVVWGNEDGFGYATVKNYKLDAASASHKEAFGAGDDNIIKKFPAGYIYQVKSLQIPDEAIGTTIDGGKDVHVYAVVTVNPWTIATGTVEWN